MDNYSILSRAIGEAFEPKLDEFIDSVNFDVNADSVNCNLTISGGVASCKSTVYGISGTTTKIVVTQTLQVKDGMSWRKITDWSKTFNSWYCSYPNSFSPIGSGTYRVKTVAKVYKGTSYETVTVYSAEVLY